MPVPGRCVLMGRPGAGRRESPAARLRLRPANTKRTCNARSLPTCAPRADVYTRDTPAPLGVPVMLARTLALLAAFVLAPAVRADDAKDAEAKLKEYLDGIKGSEA